MSEYKKSLIITESPYLDSRAFSDLSSLLTYIGSSEKTILISREEQVTTLTIPSNISLLFAQGGSINNSGTLTLQTTNIKADHQIFTGTGSIKFASGTVVKTSWFSSFVESVNQTSNANVTLLITKQGQITSNCTLGPNVVLKSAAPGNLLTSNTGFTLSGLKNIKCPNFQLFSGSGNFSFLDGASLDLAWFEDFPTAISLIASAKVSLTVSNSITLSSSLSIPSNISLKIKNGATIDGASTLTINGPFQGSNGCFGSSLNVVFGQGTTREVYPEWWGAKRDGITDDALSVDKAITSLLSTGGRIVLSPGDWYWLEVTPEIHEEIPNTLTISGYGATIHLCDNSPMAFNLVSLSGDQSKYIQNLIFEGFTVNAHGAGAWDTDGSTSLGNIVTSINTSTYTFPNNTSYRNIITRDIKGINLLETTFDLSVRGMEGISIGLTTTSGPTEIKDIYIENVHIEGGAAGVSISRQGNVPTNTNTWLDNIVVKNVRHEISEAKSGFYWSSNIIIGGGGRCGKVRVYNCYGKNSGDVGVEVDCAEDAIIRDTVIENPCNTPFYLTNYAEPPNYEAQRYLLDGCTVKYKNNGWPQLGQGIAVKTYSGVSNLRKLIIKNHKHISDSTPNTRSYGQYVQGIAAESLTIDGFEIKDTINFDGNYSTQDSLVCITTTDAATAISNVNADITFNNSTGTSMGFELIRETNASSLSINNVNLNLSANGTTSFKTAYLIHQAAIGATSDIFGGGGMRNVKATVNGIDFYVLYCNYYGNILGKFLVENCDFSNVSSFLGIVNIVFGCPNEVNYLKRINFRHNEYPTGFSNFKVYTISGNPQNIINKNFRKGYFLPDPSNVTKVEISYDEGSTFIPTNNVERTVLTEGMWARITRNTAFDLYLYFEDA